MGSKALGNVFKLRDIVNVKDPFYGAKGDGTTVDTTAIQLALTTIPDNAAVFIPHSSGEYMIGAPGLSLANKTRVSIVGDMATLKASQIATQTTLLGSPAMVQFDTCVECDVRTLTLDGGGFAHDVLNFQSCTGCTADGNVARNGGVQALLHSLGSTRSSFLNNITDNPRSASGGIRLGHYNADNMVDYEGQVHNNRIDSSSVAADGIIIGCMVGGSVTGNVQKDGFSGIIFSGHNGRTTKGVSVTGNRFTGNSGHGIQWDIVASTIDNYPVGVSVVGNICDANGGSGIYVVHANGAVVQGNSCFDNGVDGITMDEVQNVVICGNYLADTRAGGARTQVNGISFVAQINNIANKNVAITGNIAHNHTASGIAIQTVTGTDTIDNITVTGNVSTENTTHGIIVAEAVAGTINAITVDGNTFLGNGTADLRLDALNSVEGKNKYVTRSGFASQGLLVFTALDTTPSVKGGGTGNFRTNNSGGATTITNFDDGVNGQQITIYAGDANTTIAHGTIRLSGAANFVMAANNTLTLKKFNTVWIEVARGTAT